MENNSNIIWQLFGLVFGFTGFLGYGIWNVMIKNGLFIDGSTEAGFE